MGRGAAAQLLGFYDFVQEAREEGRYVYVASVEIDSAFDAAPREHSLGTEGSPGVGPFVCRYLQR